MVTLFVKLREHELEPGRLKEKEEGEKRHTITLKTNVKATVKSAVRKVESIDDPNNGNSDNEALNLTVKSFSNFMKYKNKSK